ncbi:MAG: hypothetical protein ACO3PJ_03840 [Burkholderiaceae bacterium]
MSRPFFIMLDLFDLVSPRVYVVSEKHYEEMLEKRRTAERERLEARKEYYLDRVKEVEEDLKKLT